MLYDGATDIDIQPPNKYDVSGSVKRIRATVLWKKLPHAIIGNRAVYSASMRNTIM